MRLFWENGKGCDFSLRKEKSRKRNGVDGGTANEDIRPPCADRNVPQGNRGGRGRCRVWIDVVSKDAKDVKDPKDKNGDRDVARRWWGTGYDVGVGVGTGGWGHPPSLAEKKRRFALGALEGFG